MSIDINREKTLFSLNTAHTTYQFFADDSGFLRHLYYGKWIHSFDMRYTEFYSDCGFSPNPGHIHLQRDFRWIPVPRNIPAAVSEIIGSAASVYRMETEATVRIFDMWASRC